MIRARSCPGNRARSTLRTAKLGEQAARDSLAPSALLKGQSGSLVQHARNVVRSGTTSRRKP